MGDDDRLRLRHLLRRAHDRPDMFGLGNGRYEVMVAYVLGLQDGDALGRQDGDAGLLGGFQQWLVEELKEERANVAWWVLVAQAAIGVVGVNVRYAPPDLADDQSAASTGLLMDLLDKFLGN